MKKWTQDEDDFLIKNYKDLDFAKIKNHFSERTSDAIRYRAKALGLTDKKNNEWTAEEIKLIISDMPELMISKKTNRTVSAIRKKRAIERAKLNANVDFSKFFDLSAIENNIPVINLNSKSAQYYALLNSLKVGQSFEYPNKEKELVRNQIYLLPSKKFQTKYWTEDTRRVWLVSEEKEIDKKLRSRN